MPLLAWIVGVPIGLLLVVAVANDARRGWRVYQQRRATRKRGSL